jgi:hypothetical protein
MRRLYWRRSYKFKVRFPPSSSYLLGTLTYLLDAVFDNVAPDFSPARAALKGGATNATCRPEGRRYKCYVPP